MKIKSMLSKIVDSYSKNNIIKVIFVFMIIFSISFFVTSTFEYVNYGDRLWNFQFTYKLYNGSLIYKEVEIITTPLYFILELLFFKIFCPNYLIVHILNTIINTFMYFCVYEIFKSFVKSKRKSIVYTAIIMFLTRFILYDGGAYTSLAITFYLLGVLLKIKNKSNCVTDGIILFLIFFSKQNVAVYYALSLLCEYLVLKKEKKIESLKNLIKSFMIFGGFVLCFLVFLSINNILSDFISCCFFGVKEFTKNFKVNAYIIVGIAIILFGIAMMRKYKKIKVKDSKIKLIFVYSIFMLLTSYPIIDELHISFGIMLYTIVTVILADIIIKSIVIRKMVKIAVYAFFMIIFTSSLIANIIYINYYKVIDCKYEIYRGSYLYGNTYTQEQLEKVINYIKNQDKKVVIISCKTAIYNNILKENNGIFDMPFLGNLGKDGEEGLIKKIANLKNTYILITKDEKEMLWQESKKARKYIMENYKQKDEIGYFIVYETN